jgi:hypothetical protein
MESSGNIPGCTRKKEEISMRNSKTAKKITIQEPVPKRNTVALKIPGPVKEPVTRKSAAKAQTPVTKRPASGMQESGFGRSAAKVVQPAPGRTVKDKGRGPVYEPPEPVKPRKLRK